MQPNEESLAAPRRAAEGERVMGARAYAGIRPVGEFEGKEGPDDRGTSCDAVKFLAKLIPQLLVDSAWDE